MALVLMVISISIELVRHVDLHLHVHVHHPSCDEKLQELELAITPNS